MEYDTFRLIDWDVLRKKKEREKMGYHYDSDKKEIERKAMEAVRTSKSNNVRNLVRLDIGSNIWAENKDTAAVMTKMISWCNALKADIEDEKKAHKHYAELAKEIEMYSSRGMNFHVLTLKSFSEDEKKHYNGIKKIHDKMCRGK